MAEQQEACWNALSLKKFKIYLLKKLPLAPSTIKSWGQILKALLITFFIVGVLAWVENEQKEDKLQITSQTSILTTIDKLYNNTFPKNTSTQTASREAENNNDKKCTYNFSISTLICLTSDIKLLEQAQNISVISAAILFFLDTFDRKKQLERQAWQLIDGAQGSETSGARRQAIEELYEEGSDITGLDADGADLRGINLSGADLTGASFKNAILEEAKFEGAILEGANFTGANLKGAKFKKAKLWGADFTRADLSTFFDKKTNSEKKTDLRDADLGFTIFNRAKLSGAIFGVIDQESDLGTKTNLTGARLFTIFNRAKLSRAIFGVIEEEPDLGTKTNLRGAKLRGVNLKAVNLNQVCIAQAKLGGAKIEDIDKIRKAHNYKEAYYSKDFYEAHKNELKEIDWEYYEDPEFQQMTTKKIVEISQRLLSKKSLSLQDEESVSDFVNLLNHLVVLVKESNSQCLNDHELSDKVTDFKTSLEKQQQFNKDVERKIEDFDTEIANTNEEIANTNEEIANTNEEIANTDEEIANTDEEIANTDEEIAELSKQGRKTIN